MPAGHPLIEDGGDIPSTLGAGFTATGGDVEGSLAANVSGPNTHLWVAGLIALGLVGLLGLHISGFRFATDVGVTSR